MTATYDSSNLSISTASGRLNSVRLIIGDTVVASALVQDEEITFALSESGDNIYTAGSWLAKALASAYSRKVDTELDGALKEKYSQAAKAFRLMATDLKKEAVLRSGTGLGVKAGGISKTEIATVEALTDRVEPSFTSGQFSNPDARDSGDISGDYY